MPRRLIWRDTADASVRAAAGRGRFYPPAVTSAIPYPNVPYAGTALEMKSPRQRCRDFNRSTACSRTRASCSSEEVRHRFRGLMPTTFWQGRYLTDSRNQDAIDPLRNGGPPQDTRCGRDVIRRAHPREIGHFFFPVCDGFFLQLGITRVN